MDWSHIVMNIAVILIMANVFLFLVWKRASLAPSIAAPIKTALTTAAVLVLCLWILSLFDVQDIYGSLR